MRWYAGESGYLPNSPGRNSGVLPLLDSIPSDIALLSKLSPTASCVDGFAGQFLNLLVGWGALHVESVAWLYC